MKYILQSILLLLLPFCGMGQKQNNTWVFGENGGLNFNTTPPTFFQSAINTYEAVAAVSDHNTGQLLFYTDGVDLFNSNHQVMPNGAGIGTDTINTTAQSAVIIIDPANDKRYYVFTIEPSATGNAFVSLGILRYAVVDMTLDNGLGDVTIKNIVLGQGYNECNTSASNCNKQWLISHQLNTATFHAYEVTAQGVNGNPVISTLGVDTVKYYGYLKHSPKGNLLAMATVRNVGLGELYGKLRLIDFDMQTGILSNSRVVDSSAAILAFYGCEFSADGSKLYSSTDSTVQYDLSQTSMPLAQTRKVIPTVRKTLGIQRGPDGNIYMLQNTTAFLHVITDADKAYPACNTYTLTMPAPQIAIGLPQMVFYGTAPQLVLTDDTTICQNQPVTLTAGTTPGTSYLWNNNSTGSTINIHADKNMQLSVIATNGVCISTDTVNIHVPFVNDLGNDTSLCVGKVLQLSVGDTLQSYKWSTGATNSSISVTAAGTYWLDTKYKNCPFADTIQVGYSNPTPLALGNDRLLCLGDTIQLAPGSHTGISYQWQDGSNSNTFLVDTTGRYWATSVNACGTFSDTVNIAYENCKCKLFMPNAFTPNGDGLNDNIGPVYSCTIYDYHMLIANRSGKVIFESEDPAIKWDGTYKNTRLDGGTYLYYLEITGPHNQKFSRKGDITLVR